MPEPATPTHLLEEQLHHLFDGLEAPLGRWLLERDNLLKGGQRGGRRVLAQLLARVVLVLKVGVGGITPAIAPRVLLTDTHTQTQAHTNTTRKRKGEKTTLREAMAVCGHPL